MESYSRIFHPKLLGHFRDDLRPIDVISYCPLTGLSFTKWRDAHNNGFIDPTCIIVKIHGAFYLPPSSSSTPSSSSVPASASTPVSASIPASAPGSFATSSATEWSQNMSAPSSTGWQSTCPAIKGTEDASTAFGLFYGFDSPRNSAGIVPPMLYEQSKPHVDLYTAGIVLFHLLQTLNFSDELSGRIRTVVLVTDSHYLVSCLTHQVFGWQRKGYLNAKGKPVSNAGAVKWVESLIEMFEIRGVGVRFWKVEQIDNSEAVGLARRVLHLHEEARKMHGIQVLLNAGAG